METHKGCTYWYQISMAVDKKGDGYRTPTTIRIPVRCESSGENSSICIYMNPSSATVETQDIENCHLFDNPLADASKEEPKGLEELRCDFVQWVWGGKRTADQSFDWFIPYLRVSNQIPNNEELKEKFLKMFGSCLHHNGSVIFDWFINNLSGVSNTKSSDVQREFSFKCSKCDYKTNSLESLGWHKSECKGITPVEKDETTVTVTLEANKLCSCLKCSPNEYPNIRFNTCSICGNKRCPHADDHNFKCTNSNDVGQIGTPIK